MVSIWGENHQAMMTETSDFPIKTAPLRKSPPLVRLLLKELKLHIRPPASSGEYGIVDFMSDLDESLPRDTRFNLLVPVHIQLSSLTANVSIRNYPLPLLNIPPSPSPNSLPLFFEGDLVVAEQLGPASSVSWIDCTVVPPSSDLTDAAPFILSIPKTVMPVKIYSQATMKIFSSSTVDFTWGISYMPAIQCVAKIIEGITHPPPDSSPAIGFWDKVSCL